MGGRQSGKQAAGARDGRMGSTTRSRNPRTGHPAARALGDSLNWDGEGRGRKGIKNKVLLQSLCFPVGGSPGCLFFCFCQFQSRTPSFTQKLTEMLST